MKCTQCGADNSANYRACISCGQALVVAAGRTQALQHSAGIQMPPVIGPPTSSPPVRQPSLMASPPPAQPAPAGPAQSGQAQWAPAQSKPASAARFAKNVTRYLCTAAQIDSSFCQRLVRHVIEEPRRAVASSPGVDLETVLRYALSARNRQLIRDALLALTTVLWSVILFRPGDGEGSGLFLVSSGTAVVAWVIVFGEQLI